MIPLTRVSVCRPRVSRGTRLILKKPFPVGSSELECLCFLYRSEDSVFDAIHYSVTRNNDITTILG